MSQHIIRFRGEHVALSILRPDEETEERLVEWLSDEESLALNGSNASIITFANIDEWILNPEITRLGIVDLASDELIGYCHFTYSSMTRAAEIGLTIGEKEYRGKGFGTEAVRLLLRHAFENLDAQSVHLNVLQTNAAAIRCYEKAGMSIQGNYRARAYLGKPLDWYFMDILREEFAAGWE